MSPASSPTPALRTGAVHPIRPGGCGLCGEALAGGRCPNTVCTMPDPCFSTVLTVSEDPELMWQLLCRYKYDEDKGIADDLARMLADFLERHRGLVERFDVITPIALYIGPEAPRLWNYLSLILDGTARIEPRWPYADEVIIKSAPTGRFMGLGVEARRAIAEGELRAALHVPRPDLVAGKRVLLVDDVFSEGFSLREMARALRQAGATEVAGVVFARRKGG